MNFSKIATALLVVTCLQAPAYAEELDQNLKAMLAKVNPSTGFKYFSGNLGSSHNFPAMYTYGYKENSKVVVVGRDFHKEYLLSQWQKAFEAYKALMIVRGYEP